LRHDSRQSDHTDHHRTTARPRFADAAFTPERPESAKLKPLIRYPLARPGGLALERFVLERGALVRVN
jgi:hypothetical protein